LPVEKDSERLKLQILKLISDRGSSGVYKYNLVGRDIPGELEMSAGEQWTNEQRLAAAYAFEELKSQRLIQSTMTNPIDTDNWVKLTPAGQEALKTGVIPRAVAGDTESQTADEKSLEETLSAELGRSRPTAVVFSDLDNFKAVNDKLGHDAGDRCIQAFRHVIATVVEGRGQIFRRYVGGDEFVIVLPNCTSHEAAATAERIRRLVETSNIGEAVPVTASFGVFSSDIAPLTDPLDLLKHADQLMYAAKQKKNAVASPESAPPIALEKLSNSLAEWVQESKARWESVVRERISAQYPMAYFLRGTWAFAYALAANHPPLALNELLEILRSMPRQTKCLHPWRVPSLEERKPYPFKGLIECWPAASADSYSPEFWRASPELKMFYLRKYEEDEQDEENHGGVGGKRLDLTNSIWRIGECVIHAERLASGLGLLSGINAFHVQWNGLKGRQIAARRSRWLLDKDYQCQQDSVESSATLPIGDIESKLPQLVRLLLSPLYEAFGFLCIEDELLHNELSEMLAKCAGSR
jgi:diguanylate cyclase (GGDEF)-like protein